MTPERWQRIRQLFDEVAELAPPAREARLSSEEVALADEVRALLLADDAAGDFLEKSAVSISEPVAQGTRLGPYEVIRELGHGGMGTVFLAQRADDAFHKQVAVKVVRRGLDSDHVLERFQAERRILATLEHPSIARIVDAGSTSDGQIGRAHV